MDKSYNTGTSTEQKHELQARSGDDTKARISE